jgi:tRNA threonylcarbamoyladenosine biosynthesis protein TsaE
MQRDDPFSIEIADEAEMTGLATAIGSVLRLGDTLFLPGEVGAGKSYFARALIQSGQSQPTEVPSPTYTLVQTYELEKGTVWHADLYRLSGSDEALELGLLDAMDDAICLIEWPDRLEAGTKPEAVTLSFEYGIGETQRRVSFNGLDGGLLAKIIKAVEHNGNK